MNSVLCVLVTWAPPPNSTLPAAHEAVTVAVVPALGPTALVTLLLTKLGAILAPGIVPACNVPVVSTCHSAVPVVVVNFWKLPVEPVSVERFPDNASFPFAAWLIVAFVTVGDVPKITAPDPEVPLLKLPAEG